MAVIAYADDAKIFVTNPENFRVIRDELHCFEK
jgi:hypothetical protein